MQKQIIHPPGAAPALARYSPGVLANGMLYVSGLLAISASGDIVGRNDVRAQTRHILEALREVVQAAGGDLSNVVHNAIFLKSLDDYAAMNEVYATYFRDAPPARYCIRADLVKPEFLVEVSSVACIRAD